MILFIFTFFSTFMSYVPSTYADVSCLMTSVIDGDTIMVSCGSKTHMVRIIGIDTPEEGMYGFSFAKDFLTLLLTDKEIYLSTDPGKPDHDMFGRKLRYIKIDNLDVGYTLIKVGFAKEFQYDTKYVAKRRYKAAELAAIYNKIGIWNFYKKPFASNCYIGHTSIADSSYQLFFSQKYAQTIDECKSELRFCHDGLLDGSFTETSCMVQ